MNILECTNKLIQDYMTAVDLANNAANMKDKRKKEGAVAGHKTQMKRDTWTFFPNSKKDYKDVKDINKSNKTKEKKRLLNKDKFNTRLNFFKKQGIKNPSVAVSKLKRRR